MMRHLDLFSGIGGFALAASMVWPDHEVVTFCEIEKKVHPILKRHFPGVPIVEDIRELKGIDYANVSLLTGGFPCQPFSHAGKRKGKEDNRFLWPEMLRVIREVNPEWIIGENVAGILSIDEGMVIEQVLLDLENAGYEVMPPFVIPACAVNASHRRDRVWIVAHSNVARERRDERKGQVKENVDMANSKCNGLQRGGGKRHIERQAGLCGRKGSHKNKAIPDTKHNGQPTATIGGSIAETSNNEQKRKEKPCKPKRVCKSKSKGNLQNKVITGNTASKRFPNWTGGEVGQPCPVTEFERPSGREIECDFRGVAYGVSKRVDRLKGLGNAIVPQVAMRIMAAIKATD